MSSLRQKAEEFLNKYGGNIFGEIILGEGAVAIKIKKNDRMFHIYFSRRWYYNPDGISIPQETLKTALDENATIVMYVNDEMVWAYASDWYRTSATIKNSRNNTYEKLIEKAELNTGDFDQEPKGIDSYF